MDDAPRRRVGPLAGAVAALVVILVAVVVVVTSHHEPAPPFRPGPGRCPLASGSLTPADYYARADVSELPALDNGWVKRIVAADALGDLSSDRRHDQLWPFVGNQVPGSSGPGSGPQGFPVNVVGPGHATLDWSDSVTPLSPAFLSGSVGRFEAYGAFADVGPYPSPERLKIEGYPNDPIWDRYLLTVDRQTCLLYEQINVHGVLPYDTGGRRLRGPYIADGGVVWDLRNPVPKVRTNTPQGVVASREPFAPLVLRFDEVRRAAAGGAPIDHAVHWFGSTFCRGGERVEGKAFVWPARYADCRTDLVDDQAPPYGAWFRLRADYPTDGLTAQAKAVVVALQTHGLILGDGGGQGYAVETAPCPRNDDDPNRCWTTETMTQLKEVSMHDLEAVDTSSLRADPAAGPTSPTYWKLASR